MKKLLTLLTLTLAGLVIVPTIRAEDKPAGEGGKPGRGGEHHAFDPAERLKMMTEKLGLTQDQQDKIKAIFEANAPKFKELMAKGRENLTDADKAALKDLAKSQMDAINAVLTPDQQEKAKAMREHGGGPRGGHKPGGNAPEAK